MMEETCATCRGLTLVWQCESETEPSPGIRCDEYEELNKHWLVDELVKACRVAHIHLSGQATKFSEREPIAVRARLKQAIDRYEKEIGGGV